MSALPILRLGTEKEVERFQEHVVLWDERFLAIARSLASEPRGGQHWQPNHRPTDGGLGHRLGREARFLSDCRVLPPCESGRHSRQTGWLLGPAGFEHDPIILSPAISRRCSRPPNPITDSAGGP